MNINESLLHQIAARFIIGHDINVNIKGSEIQLESLHDLLNVSKDLLQELNKEEYDSDVIIETIEKKKKLTKKFQNVSGIKWKL
jgi:hypothetical protein